MRGRAPEAHAAHEHGARQVRPSLFVDGLLERAAVQQTQTAARLTRPVGVRFGRQATAADVADPQALVAQPGASVVL